MSFRKEKEADEQIDISVIRLRKLRERDDESQEELAQAIAVSKSTISNIEQSKGKFTIQLARKIAEHYKVSVDYICGLTDDTEISRNILDELCDYLSLSQHHIKMQFPHEIPFLSMNKALFDYLKIQNEAKQLKERNVPDNVIDAWLKQVKIDTKSCLQKGDNNTIEYALLSACDIASDEIMALLEKSYNEKAGE